MLDPNGTVTFRPASYGAVHSTVTSRLSVRAFVLRFQRDNYTDASPWRDLNGRIATATVTMIRTTFIAETTPAVWLLATPYHATGAKARSPRVSPARGEIEPDDIIASMSRPSKNYGQIPNGLDLMNNYMTAQ